MRGWVEQVDGERILGWVIDEEHQDKILKIVVFINGEPAAEGLVDVPRPDMHDGAALRGFKIPFPEAYASLESCQVRVVESDSGWIVPPGEVAFERKHLKTSRYEGYVEQITTVGARGWAWDPSAPEEALTVEARLGDRIIGATVASKLRADVAKSGRGTGRYGFSLRFDAPISDDIAPVLDAFGVAGRQRLASTGVVQAAAIDATIGEDDDAIPPGQEHRLVLEGNIDSLSRREATGWAWFPDDPDTPALVEALRDGVVIGRAVADAFRADLKRIGKGDGHHAFSLSFDVELTGQKAPAFRAVPLRGATLRNDKTLPRESGQRQRRRPAAPIETMMADHARFTARGREFEEFDPSILAREAAPAEGQAAPLLLAFYLPQFHAIPENDEFWGKGFTEWRQLAKGLPRFPGHYQPRTPRDLGHYTLEGAETLRRQAAMAKAAGIGGFAFYYYWFNRKRVLERPLEALLGADVDMPFMLIWANENWTRTWDGSDSHILLKQDYDREDEDALLDDFCRHFRDPRYIRLDGRPFLVIYNPRDIPDCAETVGRWRQKLAERLGLEPLMFMAQTFGDLDPRRHGLDGAIEFPPHKLSQHLPGRETSDAYSSQFAGRVIDYDDFVEASLGEARPDFPLIKTIVPSWDNDCRRPNRGLTLENVSPAAYQEWLEALIGQATAAPVAGQPIVMINAWNEWAEAAYLEPDVHFGAAFLNATARARVRASTHVAPAVSVILPNFNHAKFLPERIASVIDQTVKPAEIIFLDDRSSDDSVAVARKILEDCGIPFRIVENEENSGCVFRQWLKGIDLASHDLIWIAETDDTADRRFLANLLPAFQREDVMAAYGRILCIDDDGTPRADLDGYYDGLRHFSWDRSCVVPAHEAFAHDFAVKNVIPNASGVVFRKPALSGEERERLTQYGFAGDWYFYALVARGGSIAYRRRARSFFRVNADSASRSSFFTERHLAEHLMIVQDLRRLHGVGEAAISAHCEALAAFLPDQDRDDLERKFHEDTRDDRARPLRLCIAAHGFAVGGGEILPVELANALKAQGAHVTYLAIERPKGEADAQIRRRLRSDIPVVYWDDICGDLPGFIARHGIALFNSHNVSVDYRLYLRRIEPGVPYVVSLHGGYETVPDLLTPEFLDYLTRHVEKWLYLAERNYAFMPEGAIAREKLLHSFNAVQPLSGDYADRVAFRAEHGVAPDAFVFVLCSRAIEAKGWETAIEITQRLCYSGWPAHLVLIGEGPAADELKEKHGKSPLVTFLGHIDRPLRLFKCFDMGLFPTRFEGETFPLFLLECFEAGLPVATTDIGEIARIMDAAPGHAPGLLVDWRLEPTALAEAFVGKLLDMFNDDGAYEAFREAARAASRKFGMATLSQIYSNLFRDLIGAPAEIHDGLKVNV